MKQKHTILTASLLAAIATTPFTTLAAFAEPTIKFNQGAEIQGQKQGQQKSQQREGSRQKGGKDQKRREQNDIGGSTHTPT